MSTVYVRFDSHGAAPPRRAPWFERLLAGAAATPVADWRAQAFALVGDAPAPAVGAAALCGALGASPAAGVCLATPVHTVAGMREVRLPVDGILGLDPPEALALAEDFARVFAQGGARLRAHGSGALFALFDRALEAQTRDPAEVRGLDLWDHLPTGRDAPRLKRIASEIEMWLHEHPVNRGRAARGAPPVTGLWLWGCGAGLAALPPLRGWTAGRDPLFGAWPARETFPPGTASGVVVLAARPGEAGWEDAQQRWLAPAAAARAAGRVARLLLSTGARCLQVSRHRRWRWWRAARPWWQSFGIGEEPAHGAA